MSTEKTRMTYDIHHAYLQQDCKPEFEVEDNPYMHHEAWRGRSLKKLSKGKQTFTVTYGISYLSLDGVVYAKYVQGCRLDERPSNYVKPDNWTAEIKIEVIGFDLYKDEQAYKELVGEFIGRVQA